MIFRLLLRLARFVFWLAFLIGAAAAHEWYDQSCCGGYDCKPIPCEELEETNVGGTWRYMPTGNIFEREQVKPSQDSQCHVCLGRMDGRSLCAYVLQGS